MQAVNKQYIFWAIIALMAGWSLVLYNPIQYYFLNDDLIHIPLSSRGQIFQRQSFRPLADLSVIMDYRLWGKRAWGYHLTNLLLHLGNTIAVYYLAKGLFKQYSAVLPGKTSLLLLALLFWVYAMHSEGVFWILGRSGSLGCLFFLLACIAYLHRYRPLFFVLSLLFFVLGLLAYESVWVVPLVVIIFSVVPAAGQSRTVASMWYPLAFWVIFIAYLGVRYSVIGQVAGSYEAANFSSANVPVLLAHIAKLLGRCFLPPLYTGLVLATGLFYVVAGGIVLLVNGKRWRSKSGKLLLVLSLLLVVSVLPYASLGIDTHGVEGERFLYLPSVFAVLLLGVSINGITGKTLQQTLWVFLIALHSLLLTRSANLYKTAGTVVHTTFNQIDRMQYKQRIFIDSLPTSYNGALIFRLGFMEGVQWLTKRKTTNAVFLLSQKANNNTFSSFYPVLPGNFNIVTPISKLLVPDSTQVTTYITRTITPLYFNPATDAWLTFTNNGLKVVAR